MSEAKVMTPVVAVIGGGPAGLSVARALAPVVEGEVAVFDREKEMGGIPRHSDHLGYGIRDKKRFMSGPKYAKALAKEALEAGASLHTKTMVTGWTDEATLMATTPEGLLKIRPKVFVFATGARERPRPARMIPGDRAAGVLTTGQLQNLVHVHHREVGKKAVVVGAELVSWSAVMTLKEAGCKTVALVSEYPKSESYALFRLGGKMMFRSPVVANSRVVQVLGKGRVSGVVVEHLDTKQRSTIDCDTVVFTGGWIPDNELLRMRGVDIDPQSLGPVTDQTLQTSVPGVFSVGNVNHPVETADVVALEGQHAAEQVKAYLAGLSKAANPLNIHADDPIRWVSPAQFTPGGPTYARGYLKAWVDEFKTSPVIVTTQDGVELQRTRLPWPAAPGRAFRIPARVLSRVNPLGGDVTLTLE